MKRPALRAPVLGALLAASLAGASPADARVIFSSGTPQDNAAEIAAAKGADNLAFLYEVLKDNSSNVVTALLIEGTSRADFIRHGAGSVEPKVFGEYYDALRDFGKSLMRVAMEGTATQSGAVYTTALTGGRLEQATEAVDDSGQPNASWLSRLPGYYSGRERTAALALIAAVSTNRVNGFEALNDGGKKAALSFWRTGLMVSILDGVPASAEEFDSKRMQRLIETMRGPVTRSVFAALNTEGMAARILNAGARNVASDPTTTMLTAIGDLNKANALVDDTAKKALAATMPPPKKAPGTAHALRRT